MAEGVHVVHEALHGWNPDAAFVELIETDVFFQGIVYCVLLVWIHVAVVVCVPGRKARLFHGLYLRQVSKLMGVHSEY